MTWAWERGEKLVMLPDQHLGRNTAYKMGVPLDEMVVWDPNEVWGGLAAGAGQEGEADSVEGALLGPHALHRRADRRVPKEVPGRAGRRASRVHVRRRPGGRSQRFDRAHHQHGQGQPGRHASGRSRPRSISSTGSRHEVAPDQTVVTLDPFGCLCSTMFRVSPNHLLWILEGLIDGEIHNQIIVPDDQKRGARLALDRMLEVSSQLPAAVSSVPRAPAPDTISIC